MVVLAFGAGSGDSQQAVSSRAARMNVAKVAHIKW
jgi:hypothetical protein